MTLAGFSTLLRLRLRRDRLTLLLWLLGLAGLWAMSAAAIGDAFDAQARTELVALLVSNPALLVMRGAPMGVSAGAVTWASVFNYLGLLTAIMAVFLAVRHSRGEGDAGREELVGAAAVGRLAPIAATLVTGVIEIGTISAGVAAASIGLGLDAAGSLLTAGGLFGIGVCFVGIGMLAGQAAPSSRAANGLGAALAGAAFLVRGVGDATGKVSVDATRVEPGPLSWASPMPSRGPRWCGSAPRCCPWSRSTSP